MPVTIQPETIESMVRLHTLQLADERCTMDADEKLIDAFRRLALAANHRPEAPATPQQIARAEARLGFEIPSLLRELLGIRVGWTVGQRSELAEEAYLDRRSAGPDESGWSWPEGWLPICNTGCGVYYCVCCLEEGFPVSIVDPNGLADDGMGPERRPVGLLHEWLARWAAEEHWTVWGNG